MHQPVRDDLAAAHRAERNEAGGWVGITKSQLGTIKRPDGRVQVTYYGLTLYRYSGDSKAGQTNGEGIQKIWYAISPTGRLVKKGSSGGGGYGGGGYGGK